jgi:hypothetical protein
MFRSSSATDSATAVVPPSTTAASAPRVVMAVRVAPDRLVRDVRSSGALSRPPL